MKKFLLRATKYIPSTYFPEVKSLSNFILSELNINISVLDTYSLWREISNREGSEWLNPKRYATKEFISDRLEEYGVLIEDKDWGNPI